MTTRADIEKLDIDAIADLATLRSVLHLLRNALLESMAREEALRAENAELKKLLFGQKSERGKGKSRLPPAPVDEDERRRRQEDGKRRREKNREGKKSLPTEEVELPAPPTCPGCQGEGPFVEAQAEVSRMFEVVPAHIICRVFTRHRRMCACGKIFSGPAPVRVGDCSQYGPGLHADAVVSKCADALPLHRLARRYERAGVPMSRSTLTDLFHRSALLLEPIYRRLVELVAAQPYVNADETPQPVMDAEKCRRGYMWTFIGGTVIAYVFSASRSGQTPVGVLGDSAGILQVDGYTGYNAVTTPDSRQRVACLSHVRRYFVRALESAPEEANHALELIRELYQVEHEAARKGTTGKPEHLALRRHKSRPTMDNLHAWLIDQEPRHLPKGPIGAAIRYALGQWEHLKPILEDPRIPLDNNVSERALRTIALGRDNFRWVGTDEAGANLATLQTIVGTCMASGINPQAYLTDVLVRVNSHPSSDLDALLPMNWAPPSA